MDFSYGDDGVLPSSSSSGLLSQRTAGFDRQNECMIPVSGSHPTILQRGLSGL